ncbi:hypothetical protein AVEN_237998-1 [Araneus ventricosus]|uniref:Uncharacterized protein n=1 Tax=Araneus ventricosus TaxID=182803 RepID=A0A4Y2VJ10_ARAVE|nr:hypothetical protein AVEN_237998-1 [Araneus ventricosus]
MFKAFSKKESKKSLKDISQKIDSPLKIINPSTKTCEEKESLTDSKEETVEESNPGNEVFQTNSQVENEIMSGGSAVSNVATAKNDTNEQTQIKVDNLKQTAKNSNEGREKTEKRTKEKKKEKSQSADQERSTEKEETEKTKENNSSKQINENDTESSASVYLVDVKNKGEVGQKSKFEERRELNDEKWNVQDSNNLQQKIKTSIEYKSDDEVRSSKEKRSDGKETAEATQDKTSRNTIKPIDDDTNDVDHSSHTVPDNSKENEMEESSELDNNKDSGQNSNEGGQKIETSYDEKNDEGSWPSEESSDMIDTGSATKDEASESEKKPMQDDTKRVAPSSQVFDDIRQASEFETELDERKEIGTKEESSKDLNEGLQKIETSIEMKSDDEDASTKEERSDMNDTGSATTDEAYESEKKPMQDDTKFVSPSSELVLENSLQASTEAKVDERKEIGTKEESTKDLNEGIDKIETSNEVKSDEEDASTKEERSDMIDTGSATKDEASESEKKPMQDDTKRVAPSSQVFDDIRQASETETELDERKEIGTKEESSKDLNEGLQKIETSIEMKSEDEDASTKEKRTNLIYTASATKDKTSEREKKPIEDDTKFVSPSSELVLENSLQASTEAKVDERKEIGTKEESTKDLNEGIDKIETSSGVKSDKEDASTKEESSDMIDTGSATKDERTESENKPMQDDTKDVAPSSQVVEDISQASETETELDERKEIGTTEESTKDLNKEIDKIETSDESRSGRGTILD